MREKRGTERGRRRGYKRERGADGRFGARQARSGDEGKRGGDEEKRV